MTKLVIRNALAKVGVTDKERQDAFLAAFEGKSLTDISEQEVKDELANAGITDEKKQNDFFSTVREAEILNQELDLDELEAVSGGKCGSKDKEADQNCCVKERHRTYKNHGCAATVEYDVVVKGIGVNETEYRAKGRCKNNDFCSSWAVVYTDISYPWYRVL